MIHPRKKAATPLVTIIFIGFGIVLVVAVITMLFIPALTKMIQGKCWADAGTSADKMVSDLKKAGTSSGQTSVSFGDCVGGVIIFNRNEAFDANGNALNTGIAYKFNQLIEDICPSPGTQKSYILIIPWKTLSEAAKSDQGFFGRAYDWLTSPKINIKDIMEWGKQKALFIQPICKGLDIEIDSSAAQQPFYCLPSGICQPGTTDLTQLVRDELSTKALTYCYTPVRTLSGTYRLEGLTICTK